MSQKQFPCKQCGAKLEFDPSAATHKCPYCGTENAIPSSEEDIKELDFHSYLAQAADREQTAENATIKCDTCGAGFTFDGSLTAGECPFCGSSIVARAATTSQIQPKSLLPFAVPKEKALSLFQQWISGLWFAPGKLKQCARAEQSRLSGMYVPHWTYDASTTSFYRGERGDDYTKTETYTERDSEGKTVTKTRQVRKTRWWPVSGVVWGDFDDILILASHSLPKKYADKLEPWGLGELVPYSAEYLSGFRAESYQVGLAEGFEQAREIMDGRIHSDVEDDIGGDHQRVHSVNTQYDDVSFKHIRLPVWISTDRYQDRPYRFLVNARSGEVQGERPWSVIKIAILIAVIMAVFAAIVLIFTQAMESVT